MKNYNKTDYALNKYSKGIVYKFANEIVEVTPEEYLAQNPDKTEDDFLELKAISDELFHQEFKNDNNKTKNKQSLHNVEEYLEAGPILLEEQLIETQEQQYAAQAISELMEKGVMTETQRRRFILHIFKGIAMREIARLEGISHQAVGKTIHKAINKIEKYFLD